MAQDTDLNPEQSKKLAGAKAAAAHADKAFPALAPKAKPMAAKPAAAAAPAAAAPSSRPWETHSGSVQDQSRQAVQDVATGIGMKGTPILHDGGVVPGTPGEEKTVKLQAGEKVLPNKKVDKLPFKSSEKAASAKSEKKPASKKHKHTHIEHHGNGTHTVRHTPSGGGEEESYAVPDMAALHQALDQHVGGGAAEPEAAPEPTAQAAPPTPAPRV